MSTPGIQKTLYDELRNLLPPLLPKYLAAQRWFGGKARTIQRIEVKDAVPLRSSHCLGAVFIVHVTYSGGNEETYALPLLIGSADSSQAGISYVPQLEVHRTGENDLVLANGLANEEFLSALLDAIKHDAVLQGVQGHIVARTTGAYGALRRPFADFLQPKPLKAEQSNSSIIYGDRLILKCFRRLEQGINPELEMGLFLLERTSFAHVPRIAGWLEYRDRQGSAMPLGILQEFVPNQGDGWQLTLRAVFDFLQHTAARPDHTLHAGTREEKAAILPEEDRLSRDDRKWIGGYAENLELLAKRTAQLHVALASNRTVSAFAPEPFTASFQHSVERDFLDVAESTFELLRSRMSDVPPGFRDQASEIGRRQNDIVRRFHDMISDPVAAMRTRIHSDYHLGQVLYTGRDFVIIDFEGEPARPIPERRTKRSPLQDVAGMLRSLHYVALAPLLAPHSGAVGQLDAKTLAPYAETWHLRAANHFLRTYLRHAGNGGYLPSTRRELSELLELHLLEKAVYELGYELSHRPQWAGILLAGISRILALG